MVDDAACCSEGVDNSKLTPLALRTSKPRGWNLRLAEIENPIPNEVKDSDGVFGFFRDNPFIPFSGTNQRTSHTLLQRLIDFKDLAPTHGACIESRKSFAFGSRIEIIGGYDPVFNIPNIEVSDELKLSYRNFLQSIDLGEFNWMTLRGAFSESFDTTGNEWLEIVLTENMGEKKAGVYHRSATECLYYINNQNEKMVGVCGDWMRMDKHPPTILPLFPEFHEYEDGSMRSIVHVKNGSYKFYGRPKSFSSFIDQYNEYQNRIYQSKQLNNGFIGNTIIEVEGDNTSGFGGADDDSIKDGFNNFADQVEQNYTNKGSNPTSVIVTERPHGASPMSVNHIPANTSHKYFKGMAEMSRGNILMAHDWSENLLRMDGSSGFSESMYQDIFKIKSATSINALQTVVDSTINTITNFIEEWMGITEFEGLAQKSVSPIQTLIEQVKEGEDVID